MTKLPCSSSSSIRPSYGGGKYYGGGATSAYAAGRRSPLGILPLGLGLGAAALIFPGLWLYGVYQYEFANRYNFRNATNTTQPQLNESLPVQCLCQQYNACGCDDNNDPSYLDSVIGNGSMAALNRSLVSIGPVNGTKTVVLNGTLPNGTDTTDTSSSDTTSAATRQQLVLESFIIWAFSGMVGAAVWLL